MGYYIPNSESFKLLFNETLVSYWLYGIKNYYDAVASPSSTYNLETDKRQPNTINEGQLSDTF